MSRPGIVVVGPERAGKRTLVAGLQQLNGPDATTGARSSTKDVIPIHLETKYYSASLELRVLPASEFHTPGPASSAALEGAEGLLLVLDATQSFPMGAAERWSELAAEASLGCQLCIANKMDAAGEGGAAAAFYEHAVAWALDHGFEPVECVATQPAATAEERDKTSVARVLEALQSNMWSNLERHAALKAVGGGAAAGLMAGAGSASRGAGAGAGSGAPSGLDALAARGGFLVSADEDSESEGAAGRDRGAGAGSSGGAGGGAAGFDLAEALEGLDDDDIDGDDDAARALRAAVTGTSLADSGSLASADAGADEAAAPSTSAADATAGGAGVAAKPAAAAAAKAGAAKKDEAALARDIDADFTKMVEEVRRVRDSAKGGQMNDDQRREAAALVTMRLMAMLGGLGGEDDDDEDEEGGGSAAPTGKGRGAGGSKAAGVGGAGAKKGRK